MSGMTKAMGSLFATLVVVSPALADGCSSKIDAKKPIDPIIECLKQLEAENISLRTKIEGLLVAVGSAGSGMAFPKGVVIASTMECKELGNGWASFDDATGKFIIGASDRKGVLEYKGAHIPSDKKAGDRIELSLVKLGDQGGEEKHALTVEEMPSHAHDIKRGNGVPTGDDFFHPVGSAPRPNTLQTERTGGGQAHNNMPPYVALYFCKKE